LVSDYLVSPGGLALGTGLVLVEHSPSLKFLNVSPWPMLLPVFADVGASQHQGEFSTGIDSAERSRYYST
jgi:hypothetical protein